MILEQRSALRRRGFGRMIIDQRSAVRRRGFGHSCTLCSIRLRDEDTVLISGAYCVLLFITICHRLETTRLNLL